MVVMDISSGLQRSNSTGAAKLEKGELKLKPNPKLRLLQPDIGTELPTKHQKNAIRTVTLASPEVLEKDGLPKDEALPKPPLPLDKELDSMAKVQNDGRIDIFWNQRTKALSRLLVPALSNQMKLSQEHQIPKPSVLEPGYVPPKLNIVVQVVGSRGDVQPFISLGVELKEKHGHRVRLATHPCFQELVEGSGLEFFSISGDPAELMAFMVKNPGLVPGIDAIKNGDISQRRDGMYKIIKGCWRSCIEAGNGLEDIKRENESQKQQMSPFIADAIIANPPSFAHIHIAEKLNLPLHIMFTMPWCPTQAFPHPLANIQSEDTDPKTMNFLSYILVEMMTWQGLGDLINRFRTRTLRLKPLQTASAVNILTRLQVPHTYCWSPGLIPKPQDWGNNVSLSGFFFLPLGLKYTPPDELKAFLDAGSPPVYIGFGSIVVDDPTGLTKTIFAAVKKAGVRALVSKGWGGIGGDELDVPENIFLLGNCPHDWLFKHVSAVVHHGGAGTTAAGMAAGRPTIVVPFFGDQAFWGQMVAKATGGPHPIPFKQLNEDNLAKALKDVLVPSVEEKAKEVSAVITAENGAREGAASFHERLPLSTMSCAVLKDRPAVWRHKPTGFLFSALVATVLASSGKIKVNDLRLNRAREYNTDYDPADPFTGAAVTISSTASLITLNGISIAKDTNRSIKQYKERSTSRRASNNSQSLSPKQLPNDGSDMDSTTISSLLSDSKYPDSPKTPTESIVIQTKMPVGISDPEGGSISSPTAYSSQPVEHLDIPGLSPECEESKLNLSPYDSHFITDIKAGPETKDMKSLESAARAFNIATWAFLPGSALVSDLTHAVARGFHNAPKLYHDTTVRETPKVTGFHSGLRVASTEAKNGLIDGALDIYTQPKIGAQREGVKGFFKGIGKGLGSFLIKPSQGIWAFGAYPLKGIAEEMRKLEGASITTYLIEMRKVQGQTEWYAAKEEEKERILEIWEQIKFDPPKRRKNDLKVRNGMPSQPVTSINHEGKSNMTISPSIATTSHDEDQPLLPSHSDDPTSPISISGVRSPSSVSNTGCYPASEPSDEEVDEAIENAIHQTSNGNAEQDKLIKLAIQTSLEHLQHSGRLYTPEDVEAAIQESIIEVNKADPGCDFQLESSELTASIKRNLEKKGMVNAEILQGA